MSGRTAKEIEQWLIEHLAEQVRLPASNVDPTQPFVKYGADSLTLVTLGGDLEVWLGRSLSPSLLWEYPTIRSFAEYLANPEGGGAPESKDRSLEDELEGMSDEDLAGLLGSDDEDT